MTTTRARANGSVAMSSWTSADVGGDRTPPDQGGMIWIPGGTFRMGSDHHYCRRCRPAARHAEAIDRSTNHVSFRCIKRERTAKGKRHE